MLTWTRNVPTCARTSSSRFFASSRGSCLPTSGEFLSANERYSAASRYLPSLYSVCPRFAATSWLGLISQAARNAASASAHFPSAYSLLPVRKSSSARCRSSGVCMLALGDAGEHGEAHEERARPPPP